MNHIHESRMNQKQGVEKSGVYGGVVAVDPGALVTGSGCRDFDAKR